MNRHHLGLGRVTKQRVGRSKVIAALFVGLLCGGCATTRAIPEQTQVDRLERINRGIYRFNRGVDRRVTKPVARMYDLVVPARLERRVRNFLTNLRAPTDILNNFLQAKFRPGFADLGRFLLNTTAGIGGFFDPAGKLGLERHPEDFGQTLAVWGVPTGSYLVLPILGPGTVRDWGAWRIDVFTDPVWHVDDTGTRNAFLIWRMISDRAALLPAERALEASFDEYSLVREAYFERRRYQIYDEAPPQGDDYLYLDEDD